MLTYLLGDVLRIFAGDFAPGEMDGGSVSGKYVPHRWDYDVDPDSDGAAFIISSTAGKPLGKHYSCDDFLFVQRCWYSWLV